MNRKVADKEAAEAKSQEKTSSHKRKEVFSYLFIYFPEIERLSGQFPYKFFPIYDLLDIQKEQTPFHPNLAVEEAADLILQFLVLQQASVHRLDRKHIPSRI